MENSAAVAGNPKPPRITSTPSEFNTVAHESNSASTRPRIVVENPSYSDTSALARLWHAPLRHIFDATTAADAAANLQVFEHVSKVLLRGVNRECW